MKAIATIFLFLCSFGLFSQCVSGDCNNGYGKYIYGNGGVYEGNFKNGYEHGFGRINFNSGAKYEGEWLNGKKSGKGTYYFADGSVKEGEFVNGVFVKGSVKLSSGDKYIGSEVNGMFNGKGTFTWTNGDKYEGDFLDGELHGNGKITKANGTIKIGVWSHNSFIEKKTEETDKNSNSQANTSNKTGSPCISGDCINGFGKLQDPNSVYEGNFLNGEKSGKGTQVFSSGARFEGNFLNGKKSGKGTFTFKDGRKYIGDFLDGQQNGKGTSYNSNGTKNYEGDWLNGNYNGKGKLYDKDDGRLLYEGDWLNGDMNGRGTLYFSNGSRYEGDFLKKEMNGKGKFFQTDGLIFELIYNNGELKELRCTNSDGRVEDGDFVWANDRFVRTTEHRQKEIEDGLSKEEAEKRKKALVCSMNLAPPKPPYNYIDNRVMCPCCNKRYAMYVDGGEGNIVEAKVEFLSVQLAFHIFDNNLSYEHMVSDASKLYLTINELGGVYGPLYAPMVSAAVYSDYEYAKAGMLKKQKTLSVDKYTNTSRYCGEECQRHCSN